MAIQSQPSRISEPFAGSGTKNVIPSTNTTPSASQAASWASGFPPECSQPISAGGCPVPRNDMNGVLNWLSQDFSFRQDGGVWEWSALADYDTQRMVRGSDGLLYWSVAQSGPGVAAGAQDPTADSTHTYWGPAPMVSPFVLDDSGNIATTEWVRDAIEGAPIYIDATNGNDANDGLTSATAVKTFAQAFALESKKTGTYSHYIVATGTYNEDVVITLASAFIELLGDVTINRIQAIRYGYVYINKGSGVSSATLTLASTTTTPMNASEFSGLNIKIPVNITSVTSDCVSLSVHGFIFFGSTLSLTCNGGAHAINLQAHSFCRCNGAISISGTSLTGSTIIVTGKSYLDLENGLSMTNFTSKTAIDINQSSSCILTGGNYTFYGGTYSMVGVLGCSYLSLSGSGNITFNSAGGSGTNVLVVSSCSCCRNECTGTVTFSGASQQRALVDIADNATMYFGTNLSFSGNVTEGTVTLERNSAAFLPSGATVSGTVTGKRYHIARGSQIDVEGAGVNRIPGSAAGVTDTTMYAYYG